jgi:hypothetical protein
MAYLLHQRVAEVVIMYRLRSISFLSAFALAAPVIASAQSPWGGRTTNVAPAYSEGYARGERAGTDDARHGDQYQYMDESDYRRGDIGYRSQYGDRDRYRNEFRQGFAQGYRVGFGGNGYNGYGYGATGRTSPWSMGRGPVAGRYNYGYETGLNDGYEAGLNDARANRRFDPIGERRYRSADRGYEREYGSKEAYKNSYREAFKQGYERGYQDGRRYTSRSGPGFFGFGF